MPSESSFPPVFRDYHGSAKFLTETHPQFQACLRTSYSGFVREPAEELPGTLHTGFRSALDGLDDAGIFQYDITQPMGPGTPCAVTKVTRTCVGEPGITYKYLGLRMFGHPWTDEEAQTDSHDRVVQASYVSLRRQNEALVERSRSLLTAEGKQGSTEFSLTLINRMENTGVMKTLREEPDFGMGRTSVSWHADSSLEHESTIAVYCVHRAADGSWPLAADLMQPARKQSQRRKEKKPKRKAEEMEEGSGGSSNPGGALPPRGADPGQWRVGLRVVHDIEGPDSKANNDISQSKARKRDFRVKDRDGVRHSTIDDEVTPAIMVETRDGDCYYMLGDFNHHHQHAVLAGESSCRYTSTHRVGLREGHTYASIRRRCEAALDAAEAEGGELAHAERWREEGLAYTEVEFEWIRQFYVQGSKHRQLHCWWHQPIAKLCELWERLHQLCLRRVAALEAVSRAFPSWNRSIVTEIYLSMPHLFL